MRFVLTIVGVCLLLVAHYFNCNEAVEFKFTNAVCESLNRSIVQFETCRIKAVSRKKNVFNLVAILQHSLLGLGVIVVSSLALKYVIDSISHILLWLLQCHQGECLPDIDVRYINAGAAYIDLCLKLWLSESH
ncbi:maker46 [Drosophila busckii]|uniref:Maker46 n=1 Tax=Drosophila busckii TaxID=30019 RepID=A0A0M4EFZ2_DROBS|nr:maker46 [Drosophila busckii]